MTTWLHDMDHEAVEAVHRGEAIAARRQYGFTSPFHLLIGLAQSQSLAAQVLRAFGFSVEVLGRALLTHYPEDDTTSHGLQSYQLVLDRAADIALLEPSIRTEHLLLAILRQDDETCHMLEDGGLTDARARLVIDILQRGEALLPQPLPRPLTDLQRAMLQARLHKVVEMANDVSLVNLARAVRVLG
jgi:ATP-dependent Clp protease ATP-binding subunit ClpA